MKAPKPALCVLDTHDYLSLVHANWRFTTSWGGDRGSGLLARDHTAFTALTTYLTAERKAGRKNGEIMQGLTNEATLAAIWPGWNTVVAVPEFAVGDFARLKPDDPKMVKRYPGSYEVKSVAKKYAYLALPDGTTMGFEKLDLEKVAKPAIH